MTEATEAPKSELNLTHGQKQVLLAYALECHPNQNRFDPEDRNYVINSGLVDRRQDHITDRGAAHVVAVLDLPFSKFLNIHNNWRQRRATNFLGTSMSFGDWVQFSEDYFPSPPELDLYWKERYAVLIKYDSFNELNSEAEPSDGAVFLAEMLLNLLKHPIIDWRKVRRMLATQDPFNSVGMIQSKEDLEKYLKMYLNYTTATGRTAKQDYDETGGYRRL